MLLMFPLALLLSNAHPLNAYPVSSQVSFRDTKQSPII